MTEPPRRLPPTQGERLGIIADRSVGSDRGSTRSSRRVSPPVTYRALTLGGGIAVVIHGDDGTVERPDDAAVVYWVGAATPANALPYDFWYTDDV